MLLGIGRVKAELNAPRSRRVAANMVTALRDIDPKRDCNTLALLISA